MTNNPDYEKEATELLALYNQELKKQQIADLSDKLASLDEDSPEYESTIKQITDLQKTSN